MRKLIVGCGYVGRRVASAWLEQGHEVLALTRREQGERDLARLGITPIRGDVLDVDTLPHADTVLYAVGWDRTSGRPMREVYVDGLKNVLDKLPPPTRLIHVSSTSVYGQTEGEWVDEDSPTEPGETSGQVVLDAENVLRERMPGALILRFAGIYGPGRLLRQKSIEAGETVTGDPSRWLNLIHVEDGVRAILAAEHYAGPHRIFNVSDGQPVPRGEFFTELARLLHAPSPIFVLPDPNQPAPPHERGQRRVNSRRLVEAMNFTFTHPTYREGLANSV